MESFASMPGLRAGQGVSGVTCPCPFVDPSEVHQMIERKLRTKRLAWMVGIAIGAVSFASLALAESEQTLRFGPKLTTDRPVRAVVGPSIRLDEQGRISLAWVEEDKDTRTVFYSRTEKPEGPIGASVIVNQPTEAPYMRQEAPALAIVGDDGVPDLGPDPSESDGG